MGFDQLFQNISTPIVIVKDEETLIMVYENKSAALFLSPQNQSRPDLNQIPVSIRDLFLLEGKSWREFRLLLEESQDILTYRTKIYLSTGETRLVDLTANYVQYEGNTYIRFCIQEFRNKGSAGDLVQAIKTVHDIIYQALSTEDAIRGILAFAGGQSDASRTYIFEPIGDTSIGNTYEWCADGVEPMIEQLSELPSSICSSKALIGRGLAVIDDIRTMSDEDQRMFAAYGIKSLIVFPILSRDGLLGYIGVNDCENYRAWTHWDLHFLGSLADVLASQILRRNSERGLCYSMEVLDVVTNSLNSIIMAVDIHTNHLLFTNNAFSQLAKAGMEATRDKSLLEALRSNFFVDSYNDLLSRMLGTNGKIMFRNYVWEYFIPEINRWYLVRSSIIKWVDGRDAMVLIATEFTNQKEREAELEYAATIDMMTGTYNRESSRKLLDELLHGLEENEDRSLVFLDLDNLKYTNDYYGHSAGDRRIMETLECIRTWIKKGDLICRWGGDEFLIIIKDSIVKAEEAVKKIQDQISTYNKNGDITVKLGFSYGIVEINSDLYPTVEELIDAADEQMYINKQRWKS